MAYIGEELQAPELDQPVLELQAGQVAVTQAPQASGGTGTVVPIIQGGTGAATTAAALANLGAAPSNATYITQTANAVLSAEQSLSALATGYMKVTTATGVISSQAVPIPIADGGTNDTGTVWTAYTPTITTQTGTITALGTVTGRYKTLGKTVFFQVSIAITTNGTGAGSVRATLPLTGAAFEFSISGVETALTGKGLAGWTLTSATYVIIIFSDGTYPGADGRRLVVSGVYESA